MTIYEYDIRMTAHNLAMVDKKMEIHLQAWVNQQVQATRESGKKSVPVFDRFDKFFDYQKELDLVVGKEDEQKIDKNLNDLFRKANS